MKKNRKSEPWNFNYRSPQLCSISLKTWDKLTRWFSLKKGLGNGIVLTVRANYVSCICMAHPPSWTMGESDETSRIFCGHFNFPKINGG